MPKIFVCPTHLTQEDCINIFCNIAERKKKEKKFLKSMSSENQEMELLAAIGMCVIRAAAKNSEELSKELEEIFSSIESRRLRSQADIPQHIQGEKAGPLNKPHEYLKKDGGGNARD